MNPSIDGPIPIEAIHWARERLRGVTLRTPLVPFDTGGAVHRILLKLENLQPIGSFKLRGAANAMALAGPAVLAHGVYTASAGNMAQGVAWYARQAGVACTVIVPATAPATKRQAIERLGAAVIEVPFDEWWQILLDHRYPGVDGLFIHPFADASVMAGNGTIGLEIHEDAPNVDAVLVPWGGGGLACGIASALRAVSPTTRVFAVEVVTAAPLTASFAAGHAVTIAPVRSFVDGMGGKGVFEDMWPLAKALLAGVLTVSVAEVAAAVNLLVERNHIVAEGAGAAPVAAALAGVPDARTIACVVSGGNIDPAKLVAILQGQVP